MIDVERAFAAVGAGDRAGLEAILAQQPALAGARDARGVTLILAALYAGHPGIAEWLASRGAASGIFEAAALGRTDDVARGLDEDPSLARAYSGDGFTALHLAAFFGRREAAAVLLDRGAEVDARSRSEIVARDNTPLHAAAANRQTGVGELLLERGADIDAKDGSGFTPLGLAATSRSDVLMLMLLERGARVT